MSGSVLRAWWFPGALLAVAGALLCDVAPAVRSARPASAVRGATVPYQSGSLRAHITAAKAGLPGAGSHAYRDPTFAEVQLVVGAVRAVLEHDLAAAATMLDMVGYRLLRFQDEDGKGEHVILQERAPCARCWGLFVLNVVPGARNVVVQAPHPLHDRLTPELGVEAYLRLGGRAFFMAGAHRYANGFGSRVSDMARNPRSIFQQLHEVLVDPGTHVVQMHGFNADDYPGYPGVLVSNGSRTPHAELHALQQALESRGERAGVYDGVQWEFLSGALNPQGHHTRAIGARFYHLEHELALRRDARRRAAVVDALHEVLVDLTADPAS